MNFAFFDCVMVVCSSKVDVTDVSMSEYHTKKDCIRGNFFYPSGKNLKPKQVSS